MIKEKIVPSFYQIVPKEEMSLTYVGTNKIQSMEDSVTFAPWLFRLNKSIILSEPAQAFFKVPSTLPKSIKQ